MANTDYLTGLKNRNAFEVDVANWERAEARACGGIVSVDLDGLKDLNDTFGHAAGDEAIKRAAAVVAGACAGEGMVYRVGGDEFVACFFDLDDERAAAFARRVHEACAAEQVEGRALSLSVGWALRAPGEGMEDLLRRADASMYEEKKRSRAARG